MLKCYLVTENNSTQTNVELEKPAGGVKNTLEGGGGMMWVLLPPPDSTIRVTQLGKKNVQILSVIFK